MTAPKLPFSGVRHQERLGNGVAGAGAVAGRGQQAHQLQNGDSVATAGQGSRWNPPGLGTSIMQPLPLASRYVGAARPDSPQQPAGSALHSTWIRRLITASSSTGTRELAQEATYVWKRPLAFVLGGGGGADSHQPPLLLAAAPRKLKDKEQDEGIEGRQISLGTSRENYAKVPANGHYPRKGKFLQEREHHAFETMVDMHELEKNEGRAALGEVNLPSHSRDLVAEGSGRQLHDGNQGALLSSRGESRVNGNSGARMTGFGSLRVLRKPPSGDFKKSLVPILKLKPTGLGEENQTEAEVPATQPLASRLGTFSQLDRRSTGTKFTTLPKSASLTDLQNGSEFARTSRPVGCVGFLAPKKKEIGTNNDRPGTVHADGGLGEATPCRLSKVGGPTAQVMAFGEDRLLQKDKSWYGMSSGPESGVERTQAGCNSFREGVLPPYTSAAFERMVDVRMNDAQPTPIWNSSRAAVEATTKPGSSPAFQKVLGNRKMKEVVGSDFANKEQRDAGPSQQQSHQVMTRFAPHQFQGDTSIGKIGLPLPFSLHSSLPGEGGPEESREGARDPRGRCPPDSPLLSPFFTATKPEDGPNGGTGQLERQPPWTSLFAAYRDHNQQEPMNSPAIATLPPDVHSRLHDGSPQTNGCHVGSRNHDDNIANRNANLPASSAGDRGFFDNQSSHFASSPWPDNESHYPNDDGMSGPYKSKGTISGYHSQASQAQPPQAMVANHTAGTSRGHKHFVGPAKDITDTPMRSRDLSVTGAAHLKNSSDSFGKRGRGQQISLEENQAGETGRPLRHLQSRSGGEHDQTSGSSPPSLPFGYNNCSDLRLPVLFRTVGGNEQLLDRQVQSKVVQDNPEVEQRQFLRRLQGYVNTPVGFELRWRTGKSDLQGQDNGAHEDHRDGGAQRGNLDARKPHALVNDTVCAASRKVDWCETGETGQKHGKLRTSGEAMGEAGTLGPSKRSRHHPNLDSRGDLARQSEGSGLPSKEQCDGDDKAKPSSWLQRWLPPSGGNIVKSPFSRPIDKPSSMESPRDCVRPRAKNFLSFSGYRSTTSGKQIEENGFRVRKDLRSLSTKRGANALPPFPIPSAAAMALVGTAARKIGPFPQERRGSFAMWPSVHLQATQAPAGKRSVQNSERVYANHQ